MGHNRTCRVLPRPISSASKTRPPLLTAETTLIDKSKGDNGLDTEKHSRLKLVTGLTLRVGNFSFYTAAPWADDLAVVGWPLPQAHPTNIQTTLVAVSVLAQAKPVRFGPFPSFPTPTPTPSKKQNTDVFMC